MTTLNLREIAEVNGLEYIETVDNGNGYPSGIEGAIIGFDNFEQAERLAERYNLSTYEFFKKDGWQLWARKGNVYSPFENGSSDYGDDYDEFGKMTESEFVEEWVKPLFPDCSSFDEIKKIISEKEELFAEIESLGEGEIVIAKNGEYYETIDKVSMSFYHDTKHYVIGVLSL